MYHSIHNSAPRYGSNTQLIRKDRVPNLIKGAGNGRKSMTGADVLDQNDPQQAAVAEPPDRYEFLTDDGGEEETKRKMLPKIGRKTKTRGLGIHRGVGEGRL